MQQIFPPTGAVDANIDDLDALAAAYAYPELPPGAAWVRANMVSSIDGAAQGPNGRSGTLSSPADRRVFALLRALTDVILAGAGTVLAEGYGPAEAPPEFADLRRRTGQPPAAPIAVVSRKLAFDPSAALFADPDHRAIVFTVAAAPADRRHALAKVADVVLAGETSVEVDRVIETLAGRGLQRVLCEGGPTFLAELVSAGRLDDLCYTITPMIIGGSATRLLDGPPIAPTRWDLGHIIEDDGTLLTRWTAHGESPGG